MFFISAICHSYIPLLSFLPSLTTMPWQFYGVREIRKQTYKCTYVLYRIILTLHLPRNGFSFFHILFLFQMAFMETITVSMLSMHPEMQQIKFICGNYLKSISLMGLVLCGESYCRRWIIFWKLILFIFLPYVAILNEY